MAHLGMALAFSSAIAKAASDAAQKKLSQHMPHAKVAVALKAALISTTFFTAFLWTSEDAFSQIIEAFSSSSFLVALVMSGSVNALAAGLYQAGLAVGDLGDTLPYLSLTSALILLSQCIVLHDVPNFYGLLGTILVSLGGFWLSRTSVNGACQDKKIDIEAPKTGLPPGSATFIGIAAMYSISSTFDKQGVNSGPPLLFGATINVMILLHACAQLFREFRSQVLPRSEVLVTSRGILWLIICWLLSMAAYLTQLEAAARILASSVSAIRRSGTLISLLIGRVLFGEAIAHKVAPVCVMIFGVTMVAWK